MNTSDVSARRSASSFSWVWALTLASGSLPVIFCLYQVWIFFDEAFPHLHFSRTLPALTAMALGLAGMALPVWLVIKRKAFIRWPLARQWSAFVAVVLLMWLAYLAPFLVLISASRRSHAILPYTPGVYLLYNRDRADQHPLSFGVRGGLGTGHGGDRHGSENMRVVDWHAWLEPPDLSRPPGPDPVVHLRGEARLDADPLTIDLEINTGRTVQFDTRGLVEPKVQKDGKRVALPLELSPGEHRFTIVAKRS